jgi:hypothetical protein
MELKSKKHTLLAIKFNGGCDYALYLDKLVRAAGKQNDVLQALIPRLEAKPNIARKNIKRPLKPPIRF